MDDSQVITKRIHISGLTPAITAKDLSDRLASFGTVKSIDGFGLLDGVGKPRKFAYATMETTKAKLARCMNLLSGVTWKGAKLRLGEAKPDYRERYALPCCPGIAKEHEAIKRAADEAEDAPPKKRRRLPRGVQGVHARDMSLVTPENVATRGGWRVTPAGRLIRPMRMRPTHPLPEPLDVAKAAERAAKGKGKDEKSKKKRVRDPPTRARRRTIDPTKWGSEHLKGIFLENAAAYAPPVLRQPVQTVPKDSVRDEESESSSSEESVDSDTSDSSSDAHPRAVDARISRTAEPSVATLRPTAPTSAISNDLVEEKNQSLGLLQSLFGDKEEWGGAESVGSDAEEEIQRDAAVSVNEPAEPAVAVDPDTAMDVDEQENDESPVKEAAPVDAAKTKLKDLFAPREEDAGFSLLGHLDLDLELDDDIPFDLPAPAPVPGPEASRPQVPIQAPASYTHTASLDPSRPFFFPTDNAGAKRRALDPTNWRTWFYRTDSPEAIRARWEETKGELTAGWKRRHREAIKSRRRRGGGTGEAD
ncbi:hypothetical protein C8Q76DRAFT_613906 [Earliella scabrosa]|nr:hypothetical protein C8Q76DRAFT_613906 [Earliella scabrosa]